MPSLGLLLWDGFFGMASLGWLLWDGFFGMASLGWLFWDGFFRMASLEWLLWDGFFGMPFFGCHLLYTFFGIYWDAFLWMHFFWYTFSWISYFEMPLRCVLWDGGWSLLGCLLHDETQRYLTSVSKFLATLATYLLVSHLSHVPHSVTSTYKETS